MLVLNWTSQYLVERWNIPQGHVGNYLVVGPILFDVGTITFGAVASARRALKTHSDLLIVAMALSASLALAPLARSAAHAIAIFSVAACGSGGIYALVTADMLARVPVERTSAAGGMTAAAQSLAHIVASPLVGWTIDRTHGYNAVLITLGMAVIPTTLIFLMWPGMGGDSQSGLESHSRS
jgi:predicted MFS family arabinose efflux permease